MTTRSAAVTMVRDGWKKEKCRERSVSNSREGQKQRENERKKSFRKAARGD